MKVYCVFGHNANYESIDLLRIYSTRALANEYIRTRNDTSYYFYEIEEEDVRDSI